jgi:small subunit ribosomal protein S6
MEKAINSYESMFVVSVADGEEAAKATVSKFTNLIAANAEVISIDDWGKRRMAYPIEDMNEGYYTVVTFKSEGAFPAELQRLANIDESVIRFMLVKLEYDATVHAEKKKAEAAARAAEAAAAKAAAEAAAAEAAAAEAAVEAVEEPAAADAE